MVSIRERCSVILSPLSWLRARPKTCRVGSPVTRSAKWLANRFWYFNRRLTCSRVVMPINAMNSGISGSVTAMISADSPSWPATTARISSGMKAAITSCGRYFEKYPSSASRPWVAR